MLLSGWQTWVEHRAQFKTRSRRGRGKSLSRFLPQLLQEEGSCRFPARPSFRPCLEILEDRLVLAGPSVPTSAADTSLITPYAAVLGGTVTANAITPLTIRGIVCPLTNMTPTLGDPDTAEVDNPPPYNPPDGLNAPFTVSVGTLSANFTYHLRAFAKDGLGNPGYGDVLTFTTKPTNL